LKKGECTPLKYKAIVVADGLEDYGDLLAVARAEAKKMLRTQRNVRVVDILYSAKLGLYVVLFEVPT